MEKNHELISIRKDLGKTQVELAQALEVSPSYVADLERGYRQLSLRVAMKLEGLSGKPLVAEVVARKTGA